MDIYNTGRQAKLSVKFASQLIKSNLVIELFISMTNKSQRHMITWSCDHNADQLEATRIGTKLTYEVGRIRGLYG